MEHFKDSYWFYCFSLPFPVPAHPLAVTQDQSMAHSLSSYQEPPADVVAACGPSERALPRSRAALRALAPGCDLTWPVPRRNSTVSSCSEPAPPLPIAMACYHGRGWARPNDDFRHGASGTGRVRWPGGSQRLFTLFSFFMSGYHTVAQCRQAGHYYFSFPSLEITCSVCFLF